MSQEAFNITNMNETTLASLQPDQMIRIVMTLKEENDKFRMLSEEVAVKKYDERLERLERELNLTKQYERRNTIEISGIPLTVADNDVENEVLRILKVAKAKVGSKLPGQFDIQAAHRKGRKGTVLCKFVNRKFAQAAIWNSRNLKDAAIFNGDNGDIANGNVYINQSLCPEFGFLHYAVRKGKYNSEIHSYKVKHGVMFICKVENGTLIEISHVNDLTRNNITVPPRRF